MVMDRSRPLDRGADGGQDARGDVDVTDFGNVGDGARAVAEDGGHHVLGHCVLGPSNLDLASQRAGRFDQPGVGHRAKATCSELADRVC